MNTTAITVTNNLSNGGFETGDFTGWNTIGDSRIETAGFGVSPTEGSFQALLTNEFGSVSDVDLETFLGLNVGTLDNLGNGDATEGSAIQYITFTANAGEVLSFDWNFLTNEGTPSFFNDFGFVVISSETPSTLANTNSIFSFSNSSLFSSETGYNTFSYLFNTSGSYTISFGVADVGDTGVGSGLLIDNLSLFTPVSVIGTSGSDLLTGTNNSDLITALAGNDIIYALAGSDTILAGQGDDYVEAGQGNDYVEAGTGDDVIYGNGGNDTIQAGAGLDVVFGGDGSDLIHGGTGKDRLFGELGNDTINGEDGNDVIDGGEGNDSVSGGLGNDIINGGNGFNILSGNAGNDILNAGDGDDTINGGTGNDVINGGNGFNTLFGDAGSDSLHGGDLFDALYGGTGNDTLQGKSSSDFLDGGNGNDRLIGVDTVTGLGAFEIDTLIGGLGQDKFILGDQNNVFYSDGNSFTSGEFDYALITDFDSTQDVIQLHQSASFYSLDLFQSSLGTIDAAIIYDSGILERGELIGIIENVSTDLTITNSAFEFV